MEKRTMRSRVLTILMAVLTLFVSVAVFPQDTVAAAAKNKAVRIKVSFNGKESTTDKIWDQNTYGISTLLKSKSKVKKNTTVSYKVVVPKTLLKKNGDVLLFCMDLNLLEKYKDGSYRGVGSINKTRWCSIRKEGKKVYLGIYNEVKDKDEGEVVVKGKKVQKVGNATIKEQGKYYVITMKDTLRNTYYDYKTDKNKKINTKKSYYLMPEFVIHGDCSKLSGEIYLDEFTVNAAKKQTVTFNKKDYTEVGGRHYGGKDWYSKTKVVNFSY